MDDFNDLQEMLITCSFDFDFGSLVGLYAAFQLFNAHKFSCHVLIPKKDQISEFFLSKVPNLNFSKICFFNSNLISSKLKPFLKQFPNSFISSNSDVNFSHLCILGNNLNQTSKTLSLSHIQPIIESKSLTIFLFLNEENLTFAHLFSSSSNCENYSKKCGSSCSLLVTKIQQQGLNISAEEATFLGVGIYKDTKCFTHSSSNEIDFNAITFLQKQEMNMSILSSQIEFLIDPFSGEQQLNRQEEEFYKQLEKYSTVHTIQGEEITLAKLESLHDIDISKVTDFFVNTHKINALFVISTMPNNVVALVGRSVSESTLDICKILHNFGGNGSKTKGIALIKDLTPNQVFQKKKKNYRQKIYF